MRKNKFLAALAIAACLATSVPLSASAATPGQATDPTKVAYGTVTKTEEAVLADMYDDDFYKEQNPDLAAAGIVTKEARFAHFIQRGVFEGRACNKDFNVSAYMAYEDLQKAFGTNVVAYYVHYNAFGKNEKRFTTVEGAVAAGKTVKSIDGKVVTAAAPKAAATSGSTTSKSGSSDSSSSDSGSSSSTPDYVPANKTGATFAKAGKIARIEDIDEADAQDDAPEARLLAGYGLTKNGVLVNLRSFLHNDVEDGAAYGYKYTENGYRKVEAVVTVSGANTNIIKDHIAYGGEDYSIATLGDALGYGFYIANKPSDMSSAKLDPEDDLVTSAKHKGFDNDTIKNKYWLQDAGKDWHAIVQDEADVYKKNGQWNIMTDKFDEPLYIFVGGSTNKFIYANYDDSKLVITEDVRVRREANGNYVTTKYDSSKGYTGYTETAYAVFNTKGQNPVDNGNTAFATGEKSLAEAKGVFGYVYLSTNDSEYIVYDGHAHKIFCDKKEYKKACNPDKEKYSNAYGNKWTYKNGAYAPISDDDAKKIVWYDSSVIFVNGDFYKPVGLSQSILKDGAELIGDKKLSYKFVGTDGKHWSDDLELESWEVSFATYDDGNSTTYAIAHNVQKGTPSAAWQKGIESPAWNETYYYSVVTDSSAISEDGKPSNTVLIQDKATGRFFWNKKKN